MLLCRGRGEIKVGSGIGLIHMRPAARRVQGLSVHLEEREEQVERGPLCGQGKRELKPRESERRLLGKDLPRGRNRK